jgi:type IV secretory pathway VirB2 component (pilin)
MGARFVGRLGRRFGLETAAKRQAVLTAVLPYLTLALFIGLVGVASVHAQGSPWERAASNLERTFTGPLARSLALVAIVIGGLTFMFGEAGAKRQLSGIVFGGGLALFAGQFLVWLF